MPFTIVQYIRMVGVAVATGTTTQYTTPASRQDVIKTITICNASATTVGFNMGVGPGGANILFNGLTVPGFQTVTWTGTYVMNAGDIISTSASATNLFLTVSGLESQ